VAISGVEFSEHVLAAGCIALLFAGQCMRNALWIHGFDAFRLARAKG
jgi:hypothetical protein